MPHFISLLLLMFTCNISVAANSNEITPVLSNPDKFIQLTPAETAWLSKHKTVRIAFDGSLPPYSFVNESGQFEGIAVDVFNALSKNLGIKFKISRVSTWNELYKAAAAHKIDVVATMVDRPERRLWFNFTRPYLTKSLVILTKKDNDTIKSRDDLTGKTVALVQGYYYGLQVKREFPSIRPYFVTTMQNALDTVSKGKADATITFMATANYLEAKHQLTDLKFIAFYDRSSADESIAVRKDWPILANLLQKGLDSLGEAEMNAIFSKWVPTPGAEPEPAQSGLAAPLPPKILEKTTINGALNWEVPTPIWIMLIVLLLWIFQVRRQNKKNRQARDEAQAANSELMELQSNLERLVMKRTAELRASEQKFRNLVENQSNEYFLYQHDCGSNFTYVSPSVTNILGYSIEEFTQHYRDYLTDNPINQKLDQYIEQCTQGIPNRPYQIEIRDAENNIRWLEIIDSPIYDDYGICIGVDGVMHEITARKEADERLIWLSFYDELTGLANRRLFIDRFQQTINLAHRNRMPFSLFFLDLDRFKSVNDNLGHSAGDEILKEAARRLLSILRESDIAARFGGDEFALLLPETSHAAAVLVGEKIVTILKDPYRVDGQQIVLGVSIGIAVYPEDGINCEALINHADSAMYHAKKEGLGFAFVSENPPKISSESLNIK